MTHTCDYHCFCAKADARNTARGGGTRAAAMAISPTVKAAALPVFCSRLKAAQTGALADDTAPTIRRLIRAARKTRRPGVMAEIRRAVAEWLASPIMTRHDLIETAAAGACMVAVTAAGVAMLLRMAVS
jgi:hypothetical protein